MSRKTKKPTHNWYQTKALESLFKMASSVFSFQPQRALREGLKNVI